MEIEAKISKFELILDSLVSNDNKAYEKKVSDLVSFLENDLGTKVHKKELRDIFCKSWRSLFFLFWNADKMYIQKKMADSIATIVLDQDCDFKTKLLWIKVFIVEFSKKWKSIDFLRLDKYIMLSQTIISKFAEKCLQTDSIIEATRFFTGVKELLVSRHYNLSFVANILKTFTNLVKSLFSNIKNCNRSKIKEFLGSLIKKVINAFYFINNNKELDNYRKSVIEVVIEEIKSFEDQEYIEDVNSIIFQQATLNKEIPENKRKLLFAMYKMLKYDQSYEEIEEQDEAKINAKAKERENVVDPVNDYILRKKYTAKSLTSNKLKRKMIDKVIKHNKRSEKIKAKFQENEVVSTGTTEKLILSKDNKYEYEEQKLISLSESESSDTEYLLKVPHLNGSPNKKVVNSVPNTNSGEQEKTQRKLSSDSKSKETNQEKTKNKKTETPSPKSKVLNEKTKKKVEEVKEDSDSEIPELVPASIESSPKQAKKEAGLNNSKAQEKIKENSSTNKKLLNSDGQTTKSALQNKLDEDNDSFEEFSSDIDDEGEQEESDDYVEGEEDDDEDYDVGVENFNTRMNNLLKQKILLRSQGKLDYDDDYEDFEDDLEDLDYMDFDDLDMYFNKPAHEEEDEQDDDQVDSGKLNENLKLAFLRSQENLKINSNIKTKTFLGKKRAANALKDAKFKKKPASNESQNRNNSSKVSFKIGSNKFNEYNQNMPISLSSGLKKSNTSLQNASNTTTPNKTPTPLKSAMKTNKYSSPSK